jgi:arsenical pump membrane protein
VNPSAAFGALALTLFLVLARPRVGPVRLLSPALGALPGVLLMLALRILSPDDLLRAARMLWAPLLTIASIMATTSVAHRLGIFDRVSRSIEIRTRGPVPRAFTAVYVIGALTAAVFNNDAAILLLTPIIVPVIRRLYPKRGYLVVPFSFAVFTSAGVAPLCTSNPMNLVVAERVGLGFNAYALRMIPVALTASVISYAMLRVAFKREIEDSIPARGPEEGSLLPMESTSTGVLSIVGATFFAYPLLSLFDQPVWPAATSCALLVCALGLRARVVTPAQVFGGVAWDVLAFLFCIFVTALGLENAGITRNMSDLYRSAGGGGATIALIGGFSSIGSALVNNHPMAILNALAMQTLPGDPRWPTLAALVGGDLGPRLLPMGSLAGLLWTEMLRRLGVEISLRQFVRTGALVTAPALAGSLLVLWLESLLFPP